MSSRAKKHRRTARPRVPVPTQPTTIQDVLDWAMDHGSAIEVVSALKRLKESFDETRVLLRGGRFVILNLKDELWQRVWYVALVPASLQGAYTMHDWMRDIVGVDSFVVAPLGSEMAFIALHSNGGVLTFPVDMDEFFSMDHLFHAKFERLQRTLELTWGIALYGSGVS